MELIIDLVLSPEFKSLSLPFIPPKYIHIDTLSLACTMNSCFGGLKGIKWPKAALKASSFDVAASCSCSRTRWGQTGVSQNRGLVIGAGILLALDYERPQPPQPPSSSLCLPLPSLSVCCWCLNVSSAGSGEYLIQYQQDGGGFTLLQQDFTYSNSPRLHTIPCCSTSASPETPETF